MEVLISKNRSPSTKETSHKLVFYWFGSTFEVYPPQKRNTETVSIQMVVSLLPDQTRD